jgi:hypothetical protein
MLLSLLTVHTHEQNRCLSLESMTAEGKGAVAELTQRGEKYRKAYKELGEWLDSHS